MLLAAGQDSYSKQAAEAGRNSVITMSPLDLNHTHPEIHESMNFETWEVKSAFSLSHTSDAPQYNEKA